MKILYLYSELMGYQIPVLKELVTKYNAELHVIHWDKKKLTPYYPPEVDQIYYYKRSDFSKSELKKFIININPDLVYISGWMDKGYLFAAMYIRKLNIPVVTGFDGIWKKTIRQRFATLIFPFLKGIFFSHAWVAGPFQFEYAKRLGFINNEIIFNCYSADIEIFNSGHTLSLEKKRNSYPHRFLFVGRFEKIKGLDILVQAWNELIEQKKNRDWKLHLIGNGSMFNKLSQNKNIDVEGFMSSEKLVQIIQDCGCFILPSLDEPWGLVVHEFSAVGLPIICSDICGAAPVFVIPDFNGFSFKSNNIDDLKQKMIKIINSNDDELILMSKNSHEIGQRITPQLAAASFMSVLQ